MKRIFAVACVILFMGASTIEAFERPANAARTKTRRKVHRTRRTTYNPNKPKFGFAAALGWEAPYGNGVSIHFSPRRMLDLNFGVGYNLSGVKVGAGSRLLLYVHPKVALQIGAGYAFSAGGQGEIAVDGKFQGEGESVDEAIVATTDYTLSNSHHLYALAGIGFHVAKKITIHVLGGYDAVVAGNDVTLGSDVRYDKNIDVTNGVEFQTQFDERAKNLVKAGGVSVVVMGQLFL